MLANVIHRGCVNDGDGFFSSNLNPLTLKGLKELFEIDEREYKEFLEKEGQDDNNTGLWLYLLEKGISDEEMIEEVLKQEKTKWLVTFDEDNMGSFNIYEVLE